MNIAHIPDDEMALLLEEKESDKGNVMLLKDDKVSPRLNQNEEESKFLSNLRYLDKGASNQMTRRRSKFMELNEKIT